MELFFPLYSFRLFVCVCVEGGGSGEEGGRVLVPVVYPPLPGGAHPPTCLSCLFSAITLFLLYSPPSLVAAHQPLNYHVPYTEPERFVLMSSLFAILCG